MRANLQCIKIVNFVDGRCRCKIWKKTCIALDLPPRDPIFNQDFEIEKNDLKTLQAINLSKKHAQITMHLALGATPTFTSLKSKARKNHEAPVFKQ